MRVLLLILLCFLGITAILGSRSLIMDPTGADMGTSVELLRNTPFPDFFWPALFLCVFFGVGSLVIAMLVLLRWKWSLRAAQVIGAGHMIWITYQWLAIEPKFWLLQSVYFLTGLGIFTAAHRCRRAGVPSGC